MMSWFEVKVRARLGPDQSDDNHIGLDCPVEGLGD